MFKPLQSRMQNEALLWIRPHHASLSILAKQGHKRKTKLIWNIRSGQGIDSREDMVTHTPYSIATGGGGSGHVSKRTSCIGTGKDDHERCIRMGGELNSSCDDP